MKKLIVVTLITMLIFSGCTMKAIPSAKSNATDVNTINSLTIVTLPSPPKEKIITKRKALFNTLIAFIII